MTRRMYPSYYRLGPYKMDNGWIYERCCIFFWCKQFRVKSAEDGVATINRLCGVNENE